MTKRNAGEIVSAFDINNGMRKNFLNPNFTFIDREKGFDPCCNRNLSGKIFFEP
jgi:hypothetical protein